MTQPTVAGFAGGREPTGQGIQAATRGWKGKETDSTQSPPKGMQT